MTSYSQWEPKGLGLERIGTWSNDHEVGGP